MTRKVVGLPQLYVVMITHSCIYTSRGEDKLLVACCKQNSRRHIFEAESTPHPLVTRISSNKEPLLSVTGRWHELILDHLLVVGLGSWGAN